MFAKIVPMKDGNTQRMESIGSADELDRRVEPLGHARYRASDRQRYDHALGKGVQQIALDFEHDGKDHPIRFNRVCPAVKPRHVRTSLPQPDCAARQRRTRWA